MKNHGPRFRLKGLTFKDPVDFPAASYSYELGAGSSDQEWFRCVLVSRRPRGGF